MGCRQAVSDELVEKYISGQLEAPLQEDFEVHLLQCAECLERVETLDNLRASLEERAHEIRLLPPRPAWQARLVWSAGFSALILLCTLGVWRHEHQPPRQMSGPIHVQQPAPTPVVVMPAVPQTIPEFPSGHTSLNYRPTPKARVAHQISSPAPEAAQSKARPEKNFRSHMFDSNATLAGPEPERMIPGSSATPTLPPLTSAFYLLPGVAKSELPHSSVRPELSDEAAVELYRLGQVEPAPYVPSGSRLLFQPSAGRSLHRSLGLEFDNAMAAYVEQRYNDAAGMLENVLRAEPGATAASFYLGVCRLLAGHPKDAIEPLTISLQGPTSALTQSAHFYLGKAYVQTGKLVEAQKEMQAAAALPGRLKTEAFSLAEQIEAFRKNNQPAGNDGAK